MKKYLKNIIKGFTLIEVLVAAVIFSLVMTALYTTYTTGLNSYERSQRNREMQQNARAIFDLISRDVRSIYWRNSTEYNVLSPQEELKLTNLGFSDYDEKKDDDDSSPSYEYLTYDLSFNGTPNSLSFVRYQSNIVTSQREIMNLARIEYSLKDGTLLRSIKDTIKTQSYNYYTGEKRGKNVDEDIEDQTQMGEIVAKGIKEINLKYLYFSDGSWHWTESWNSESNVYRNPVENEETEEKSTIEQLGGDPLQTMKSENIIPDGLPSCIEVTLVVQNRTNEKIIKKYQTLIDIPTALETWIKKEESVTDTLGRRSSER